MLMQQMQSWQQLLLQLDAMLPDLGIAVNAGLAAPQAPAPAPEGGEGKKEPGTAEERVAKHESDTALTAKARQRAAKASSV
jgi:hypothetical protein